MTDTRKAPKRGGKKPSAIGKMLAEKRAYYGFTLRELADISGVSNPLISQIETGHVRDPGFETTVRLCRALAINSAQAFFAVLK